MFASVRESPPALCPYLWGLGESRELRTNPQQGPGSSIGGDESSTCRCNGRPVGQITATLITGHARANHVAAMFSLHVRTFAPRLEGEGTSFQQLLDQSRFEIARQLLDDTAMDIRHIAAVLDYADASAFTRAFRRWSASTPDQWRTSRSSPSAA